MPTVVLKLYKFDLNANSSFKVIYQTDQRTKQRLYASPFKEHNNGTMV